MQICASADNDNNFQTAIENIVDTQSKMHDFYRLLRSLKQSDDPGPESSISSPLACDLSLKCHRIYAKFASIQNKLDVYKYEMVLNDTYYKEKISELNEIKERIQMKMNAINQDFEEICRKNAPIPTDSLPVVVEKKQSHTHGLSIIPKAANSGQKGVFGLNKGGGSVHKSPVTAATSKSPAITTATTIKPPAACVTATVNTSPAYTSVFAGRSPNYNSAIGSKTSEKPYRPLSTTLYQVSSQLGQHITEYHRNR